MTVLITGAGTGFGKEVIRPAEKGFDVAGSPLAWGKLVSRQFGGRLLGKLGQRSADELRPAKGLRTSSMETDALIPGPADATNSPVG